MNIVIFDSYSNAYFIFFAFYLWACDFPLHFIAWFPETITIPLILWYPTDLLFPWNLWVTLLEMTSSCLNWLGAQFTLQFWGLSHVVLTVWLIGTSAAEISLLRAGALHFWVCGIVTSPESPLVLDVFYTCPPKSEIWSPLYCQYIWSFACTRLYMYTCCTRSQVPLFFSQYCQ